MQSLHFLNNKIKQILIEKRKETVTKIKTQVSFKNVIALFYQI